MGKYGSNKAVWAVVLAFAASAANAQNYQSSLNQLTLAWNEMIAGVGVSTSQTSASGNQVATTALKAAEANATAIARFDVRQNISGAVNKFSMGRDQTNAACGPVEMRQMAHAASERNSQIGSLIAEADQDFMRNGGDAAQVQATLNRRRAEFYCSQEEFDAGLCTSLAGVGYNTGPNAGDTNAAVFMNGGASGAEEVATGLDFIDRIAPLPTVVPKTGASSAISRIIALRNGAEKSMAREVIGGSIMEGLE